MSWEYFAYLPYGILFIGLLLVGRWIVHAWRMRRPAKDPLCPCCGYIIHGLPEPRCPECNADLTKTGYVPTGSAADPFLWPMVGYTAASVASGFFVGMLLNAFVLRAVLPLVIPSEHHASAESILALPNDAVVVRYITIGEVTLLGFKAQVPAKTLLATITGRSPLLSGTFELTGATCFSYWTIKGKTTVSTRALQEADVEAYLVECNCPFPIADRHKAARDLHALLTGVYRAPDLRVDPTTLHLSTFSVRAFDPRGSRSLSTGVFHSSGYWLIPVLWVIAMRLVLPRHRLTIAYPEKKTTAA